MSSIPPPPALPPIEQRPPRRSTGRVIVALVVVIILIVAFGGYLAVLAPHMSVVSFTHGTAPTPVSVTDWQYSFTVTVRNSGYFTGNTTIVCTFSYVNVTGNGTSTYEGTREVKLSGGEQGDFDVSVTLPAANALASIIAQNKTWEVHLA